MQNSITQRDVNCILWKQQDMTLSDFCGRLLHNLDVFSVPHWKLSGFKPAEKHCHLLESFCLEYIFPINLKLFSKAMDLNHWNSNKFSQIDNVILVIFTWNIDAYIALLTTHLRNLHYSEQFHTCLLAVLSVIWIFVENLSPDMNVWTILRISCLFVFIYLFIFIKQHSCLQ